VGACRRRGRGVGGGAGGARQRGAARVCDARDDLRRGRGFDVEALAETGGDRFGIARSIRGRIEDLGGDVRIDSAPGRGTEVEIRVPLVEEETS
jgi:signal transduction histidine kinase